MRSAMNMRTLLSLLLIVSVSMFCGPAHAAYSAQMQCVQKQLNALGHDAGPPDGLIGGKTRAAAGAYLASAPGQGDLPALSGDTAAQWCTALAVVHPDLATIAAGGPDDVLIAGDGVSSRHEAAIEQGLRHAHDFMKRRVGVELAQPVRVFAGTDKTWLTENYLQARNLPRSFAAGKLKEFGACEPPAEGGYYVIFLCMNADAWKRSAPDGNKDAEVMAIVMHEYTHNLQFGLVGERGKNCCTDSNAMSIFGPQWLVEGSAEYLRFALLDELGHMSLSRYVSDTTGRIRDKEVSLASLETRKGYRENPHSWDIAPLAAHYLLSQSGLPSLATFWTEIGKGTEMRKAFRLAFGRTTEEFDTEFAAAIR